MFEFSFDYILNSDSAHYLIGFSVAVVFMVCWVKKQAMKFMEKRNYFKRLKYGDVFHHQADTPIQLKLDFY